MAKRFLSIFKSSHNKRENKENNDPLITHHEQQRTSRRVNFISTAGGKPRNYMAENEDDDGSEVTLTATEASRSRYQQVAPPPNPYSVVTEPKRSLGPRSCPGGVQQFDFDSLENDFDGQFDKIHERSMEARSEFLPRQQHRRSSRRRIFDEGQQRRKSHNPFNEVGNADDGQNMRQQWELERAVGGGIGTRSAEVTNPSHYKNLHWVDSSSAAWTSTTTTNGKDKWQQQKQVHEILKEQQKELAELGFAYREERAKRKALQRDLRREQLAKEQLTNETYRLNGIIGLLIRQQHTASNAAAGLELHTLLGMGGLCTPTAWNTNTPSSSSQGATATAPPPAQWPISQNFGIFSALQNFGIDHHNNNHHHHGHGAGGPGEYLAHLSSSSLLSHPQQQNQQGRRPLSQEDEVKVFRSKHTDSSFSGSSRPTTGELAELERDKNELISDSSRDQTNFSALELGRFADPVNSNGTLTLLGHSFSADNCQSLLLDKDAGHQGWERNLKNNEDNQQPSKDDGYSTSETNMSTPGPTIGGDQQMEGSSQANFTRRNDPMRIRTL